MRRASVLLVLVAAVVAASCGRGSGPETAPGQVSIFRDEWGVPHIYAELEEDGYFGLGYAMAEDHLERFCRNVLMARGELATAMGGEGLPEMPEMPVVEMDAQMRMWRIIESSREALDRLDTQLLSNYESYAAGVRYWMAENPGRVPDWAPVDISAADVVAVPRAGLWTSYQAGLGVRDCQRGGVNLTAGQDGSGDPWSNEWAVVPERSATGGAILLTDPHGGIDGRFTHEYRLHAGRMHSAGFAFAAQFTVARNARVGWGMTTGSPDVADCYVVETDPQNPLRFLFDGEPREMETRDVVIEVKDGEPVERTFAYTHHNGYLSPVVARDGTKAYVVSTAYMDDAAAFHNTLYWMSLAEDTAGVREAMRNNGMFPQNVLTADVEGNLLYVHAGKTPVRPEGEFDWLLPVDGNTSATAWLGIHPLDELLVVETPAAGYLQNNNIDPRLMDVPPPFDPESFPDYILDGGLVPAGQKRTRARRAVELLSTTQKMTRLQAFEIAMDEFWLDTEEWLRVLESALAIAPPSDESGAFLEELLAFDGFARTESTAALKYVYWREALREVLTLEEFQTLMGPLWSGEELATELAPKLVAAVAAASTSMLEKHEGLEIAYGAEFRVGGDQDRSWPLGGGTLMSFSTQNECMLDPRMCPITLRAFWYLPKNEDGIRLAAGGSRMLRLDYYSPEGIESFTAHNPGHSDVPESGHTDDQAEKLMSTRTLKKVHFLWSELEEHVVSERILVIPRSP
jgi:acyl-homoserine-lactone acylase